MTTLIIAAFPVALAAFLTRSISASALGIERNKYRWGLLVIAVVPAGTFFIVRMTLIPLRSADPMWSWPPIWSDAAVILVSLYTAAILLLTSSRPASARVRRLLWIILLLAAVSHFANGALYPIWFQGDGILWHASIFSLLVAAGMLCLALRAQRLSSVDPGRPLYGPRTPSAILVAVFGLTHGLLAYFFEVVFVVNQVLSALLVGWAAYRLAASVRGWRVVVKEAGVDAGERVRKLIDEPQLRYWIPIFILAYPLFAAIQAWLNRTSTGLESSVMFGNDVNAFVEVTVLIGFNGAYVLVVWFLVGFGLDRVSSWAAIEAWRKRGDTLKRMAGATPLLLIFVIFFALTAETWQIAANLPIAQLLALLAVLLGLTTMLVIGWSVALIENLRFAHWTDVEAVLDGCDRNEYGDLPHRLAHLLRTRPCGRPSARRLRAMAWLNALLVLLVYQSFTLGAVVLTLFVAFLGLVLLAVPSAVAAEWIFGDGQSARASELVVIAMDRSLWASPWLRVSAFLALFSLLYFVALSLSDEEKRIQYFRGIDVAMARRIAIYLCYRHLSHDAEFETPVAPAQREGGRERLEPGAVNPPPRRRPSRGAC
ncbi:hypothetical protein O7635_29270 [Asanoa sp. WMMD1127]|uniref:hypothetical protein n=1 Tax=Asanoa sp. WMMD1127 TaxID=3016107 RepID=UPI0024172A25|nr:hypothetical protein [Asanoa sp. WMMD1127]MDG4825959.1 hypothetical protein [Asanoa sp. WMMD1127]